MDAFLLKKDDPKIKSPFESKQITHEEKKQENEPPKKKVKQDIINVDDCCVVETKKDEPIMENGQHEDCEENDQSLCKNDTDDLTCTINSNKDDDNVSPPKQKRRKLSNEEKEALAQQREEARLLREKLNSEKELDRKRKEKEKEDLKQKKEKERIERQLEKEMKEKEKQVKKDQLEKERLEKQKKKEEISLAKEEDRKKKEEEKKLKDDEKKQKDDEKKQKDDEKKQKDEEEERKKEKTKSAFRSFFIKKTPTKKTATVGDKSELFAPFEIQPNMTLAPLCRVNAVEDKCEFDKETETQERKELYLSKLKSKCLEMGMKYTSSRSLKMKSALTEKKITEEEVVVILDVEKSPVKETPEHNIMRVKLIQFSENNRPAYYGTWRKRSKLISPKNPFKKDEDHLSYEIDSDDEWEEEEPGESLSGPENDDDEDNDEEENDEEDDGFFVPHGYLSDDEGIEESDGEKEEEKVDIRDRKLNKTDGFPFDKKGKVRHLRATCFGTSWLTSEEGVPSFLITYKMCPMVKMPLDVFESRQKEDGERRSPSAADSSVHINRGCAPLRVPEDAMPLLINHVHKNSMGLNRIIISFLETWKARQLANDENETQAYPKISKRQLEKKIVEIAQRDTLPDTGKSCYFVHKHLLAKYETELQQTKELITSPSVISTLPKSPSPKSTDLKTFLNTSGTRDNPNVILLENKNSHLANDIKPLRNDAASDTAQPPSSSGLDSSARKTAIIIL